MKCKKEGCEKEAAESQVYCSRDCAPYGWFGYEGKERASCPYDLETPRMRTLIDSLRRLGALGLTQTEIAQELGISRTKVCWLGKLGKITLTDGRSLRFRKPALS